MHNHDETARRIKRAKTLISVRLTLYLSGLIAVVALALQHSLKPVVFLGLIVVCAVLACLEMCPRCHAPYILQKGKGLFRLGDRCGNCDYPIGIPYRKKRGD